MTQTLWPYGTMSDEERAMQSATIDAEARPQYAEFYREMMRKDSDARETAGFGVLIPARGVPVFLELGLGLAAANTALGNAVGPERIVRPLFKDMGDGENFRGFVGRYLVCAAAGAPNQAATSLLHYASGSASRGRGVVTVYGDAVLIDVHGPGRVFVYTGAEQVCRIEDIRRYNTERKFFDFEKYVVGNSKWWPEA